MDKADWFNTTFSTCRPVDEPRMYQIPNTGRKLTWCVHQGCVVVLSKDNVTSGADVSTDLLVVGNKNKMGAAKVTFGPVVAGKVTVASAVFSTGYAFDLESVQIYISNTPPINYNPALAGGGGPYW